MGMTDDTFMISRADLWKAWREGRLRRDSEVLPLTSTDPDALELAWEDVPHAIERLADDGGRA